MDEPKTAIHRSEWLDVRAVRAVAEALGGHNAGAAIDECRIGDVKHVVELLARVELLEEVAPGFVASMFDTFTPHFIREHNRAVIAAEAQKRASAAGFGPEWAAAIEAGKSPGKAGFVAAMVEVVRAAKGVAADQAVDEVAQHYDIAPESVQRAMRRSAKKKR